MGETLDELVPLLRETATQYSSANDPAEKQRLLEKYVHLIIEHLLKAGLEYQNAAPLFDALASATPRSAGTDIRRDKRSTKSAASPAVLARACAVMDLLVAHGKSEGTAAQLLARQLVFAGVRLPEFHGDPRGWKGLLNWRARLLQTQQPDEARLEYERFTKALAELPVPRAEAALGQRVWDRRAAGRRLDGSGTRT